MRNKLVVVADLGHLKAYRVEYDEVSTHPKLDLIAHIATDEADGRLSDKLTDEAGRFMGGQRGHEIRASGERHNITLEFERRAVGQLAKNINHIIKRANNGEPVYFAAHKEINHQILQHLDPSVRARIEKIVPEDLVKVKGMKLLEHF
ncbi:MAG TPA: host attachment protein [Verrucomicrobiae bacterium]|nr:host attachment protein [Verrucomicrobiae bacterium]